MGKHEVTRYVPSLFHPESAARNREIPRASPMARIARGYNSVACRMGKMVFAKSQDFRSLQALPNTVSSSGACWPFLFRTSDGNTLGMEFRVGFCGAENPTGNPTVDIEVREATALGSQVGQSRFEFPARDFGITVGPSEVMHKHIRIGGMAPNTEYQCISQYANGARLVYMTCYEVARQLADDSISIHTNPTLFVNGSQIQRVTIADLNNAAVAIKQHHAGHIFSWCSNYSVDQDLNPQIDSTTFVPVLGAGGPTFHMNLSNRGTLQRPSTIPVRMAVRCETLSGGGGGDVQFRVRATGGQTAGFTAAVTGQIDTNLKPWYVASVDLPEVASSWTMEANTGGLSVVITGWSIYEWEP